jgi:type IV pilus assembly protein PilO
MEKFASWPKWGQYLATFIVAGILIFALWYLLIKDQRVKGEDLDKQIGDLVQNIRQGQEAQKRLDELNRQMEIILRDLEVFKSIIPLDPQTGTLLRAFQSFARDQNLDIAKISPQAFQKKELYSQQPYSIQVTGGYHDIALFFDKLAHMRRIVNVSGLELTSVMKKNQPLVGARFDAMVYMQNPEETEVAAAKPKEKKP